MAGKEYKIAFELQAKLDPSYNTGMRKVLDNLNDLETKARSIEAIRISGDLVRPLREGLQAAEREFDALRRMPSFTGIFTETVKELKESVKESALLLRNLQQIATIRMPSNMFGNDLQRYSRDMQDLERRMREINNMDGPDAGGSGGGGSGGGEGSGGGASGLTAGLAGGSMVAAPILALGASVAVATGLAVSGADEYQKAVSKMQAKTLLSNEAMEGQKAVLKGIYSQNYGESWDDISDAMSQTTQVLHLQGKELQDTATGAILLRDSFDMDYAESLKSASVMATTFGGDANQAFNMFAQGAAAGLNGSGDMLDTLNEYSPAFKSIGADAENMMGILGNGFAAGAKDTDLVADAINEFSIKSIEVGKATSDAYKGLGFDADKMMQTFAKGGPEAYKAFQQVTQAIEDTKDPVKQNTYGVSLFGTQFEQLGVKAFSAMNDTNNSISTTRDALGELAKVRYNSMGEALGGIGRIINAGVIIPISDKLLPLVQIFSDKMTSVLPVVQKAFGKIGGAVKEAYTNVQWLFENGFDGEMEGVTVNYLTAFGMDKGTAEKIASTIGSVYDSVAGVVDKIKGMFSGGGMDIAAMFGIKGSDIKGISSDFKDMFGGLADYWSDFIGNLVGLWPSIQKMIGSVLSIIPKLLPIFGKIGTAAITGFAAVYKAIIPIANYLASNLWPIISKIFTFLSTQVFPRVASMITGLIPPIMVVVGKAGELFGSIGTAITRAFAVVKPALDAVFAAFNFVWPVIQVVVTNAIDAIGGVIKGLLKSLGGIIDFVTGIFSGDWGKAWGGVRDTFAGIFEGMGSILVMPINIAVDAINAAIRGINNVSFDVPDWVPKIGGEHFGINIPQVPKLGGYAKGGYVDSPEMAWVGEGNSPEWIIPENNSARSQGLLQAANRSMGGGNAGGNTVGDFNFSPTYNFYGNADKQEVQQMEKRTQRDFEKEFAEYKRQRLRVSFT
ncbi:phage tail tape measure protein [Paenibacillus sp. 19GGS1-52]|uniref:phage tail tape measure protein n=1 Tax=Paenibacillus sp. 19GGS1-52 TaxID=2758563 RepID=UPI001EFBF486|nr:phage tail tape measure protein [Paenibacillus sp. 19GGS1-52]ULO05153.1 phage tail tape measure protein [Paenibacillus sp. 19GGS1-52]